MTMESTLHQGAHPLDTAEDLGRRWMTGALLLIVADASFVVAMSFTYLYLRGVNTEGEFHPPKSATASLWWPWIVTVCMVAGFAAYRWGLGGAARSLRSSFVGSASLGVLMMVVALVLNILQLANLPFKIQDNAYSSAVFVIAAGNVFHLLITVFVGIGAANRVRRGLIEGPQMWSIRIVGVWWAWVCVASAIGALTITMANGVTG
jgi:heme/copper-type cytochrome/quinol oxidase subunit 3